MAVLHAFDYIFALGLLVAFLDAWNIGANDVANSFATSVSSRSLTLKQAMMIATVMEFAGAVLVGSRVADTIRSKILSVSQFEDQPAVLMLGMLCALIGSSTWLTIATKIGLPVSTTHCIVGGVIGIGIATLGADGVVWATYVRWKGVSQVFAAWAIAPAIAAGFAIIIFSITQYGVLRRKNPLRAGFIMVPFYFAITSGVLTMLIVWKGAPSLKLDDWSASQILGCIFGVAAGVVALYLIFLLPYLHRRLELNDWTLKPYHILLSPLLWRRGEVPPPPEGSNIVIVQDYYRDHDEKASTNSNPTPSEAVLSDAPVVSDVEKTTNICPKCHRDLSITKSVDEDADSSEGDLKANKPRTGPLRHSCPEYGAWYTPRNLFMIGKHYFFRGVDRDVVAEQHTKGTLSGDIKAIHAHTPHFDNKTEHLYSFLQVLTASVASFAHGSNDVSNAIGPLATIYLVWHTSELSKKAPVPIWVLVFGASAIVIGLWTYGYNIMRNLGNRLTKHSPSRGFSMELGSALAVILATRLALPISTTQCITGATVGVGLTTGTWRAINWRMVGWIYMGWIITLPVTGIISGCLMGIIINAPTWGTGNFA